ncbi:MAG: hypothetical protein ACUVTW_02570 [Thermogutta sp.]
MRRLDYPLCRSAFMILAILGLPLAYGHGAHGFADEPTGLVLRTRAQEEDFHPPVVLLDDQGRNVLAAGRPVSAMKTCGACHDTEHVARHCYHADLGIGSRFLPGSLSTARHAWDYTFGGVGSWNPLNYQRLSPPGDDKPDLGLADWLRVFGYRYTGGTLGTVGFGDKPLATRPADVTEPAPNAPQNTSVTGWDPDLQSTDLGRTAPRRWDWSASGTLELNCFLCHLQQPDNSERVREIQHGNFGWATTATLAQSNVVRRQEDQWSYIASAFDPDGNVNAAAFRLVRPTARHCGQCHGKVHTGSEPLEMDVAAADWSTLTKGQVFSGQRMSDSAVNLRDKARLSRPWDVHAAALLDCRHCHFSLDNPALFEPPSGGRPAHLAFEPRRLSFGEYLRRPSHQFAKGDTPQSRIAPEFSGTMRTCRDCHRAEATHDWLPFRAVHLARLECETCHIPSVHAPAVGSIDWLASRDGRPVIAWRGLEQAAASEPPTVTGFRPVILPRRSVDGRLRLGPYNVVLASYWQENGTVTRPVRVIDLATALGSGHSLNDSGGVAGNSPIPLGLAAGLEATSESNAAPPGLTEIARQLQAVGVQSPDARFELYPFAIHHGVQPSRAAIRECAACHGSRSILGASLPLRSSTVPKDQAADLVPQTGIPRAFRLINSADGDTWYSLQPIPERAGFYVLGKSRRLWADIPGMAVLCGVVVAILIHATLRIQTGRKPASLRSPPAGEESKRS